MRRRRLVLLVSAVVLGTLSVLTLGAGFVVTNTDFGREQVRVWVQRLVSARMDGSLHIGRLGGNLLTGLTLDSVEVRDSRDSLVFHSGPISVSYDPRDLIDRRIHIRRMEAERPFFHVRELADGSWNYKKVFRQRGPSRPRLTPRRALGDFVIIDSARVHDGMFLLTQPWEPDDSLTGARRDSSIRVHLDDPTGGYRRSSEGFTHTRVWSQGYGVVSRARIADPDSAGQRFVIDTVHVVESDPPFTFRNGRAVVERRGDSVWVDVAHVDLPGSTGRARGKIVWGSDLPMRYDIRVWGDSVSLADIAWVYPTLPRTGGGRMVLDIRNDPANLRIMNYRLTSMDVRSTGSRLLGEMTFGVGGPVLLVRDVRLRADPVDFRLLETLAGEPFPVPWAGTLTGTVVARGGPLNRFVVDASDLAWRDTHVRGAVSQFGGRGELDILFPSLTVFRGFRADVRSLDLRSIQYLFENFPRIGGTISGVATLDSSWLDVRFRNADVTHRSPGGVASRAVGEGRVTWGPEFLTYDLALEARPIAIDGLVSAYPAVPLRGPLSGPIRARGTVDDLEVSVALTGPAGSLRFDGTVDAFAPTFRARGRGSVLGLDVGRVTSRANAPRTAVTGDYDIDLAGDALETLSGVLTVSLDRSMFENLRINPSAGSLKFADGRVTMDGARLETGAATFYVDGALGLSAATADSLRFRAIVDSLGGLRDYFGGTTDTLGGSLIVEGVAYGWADSVDIAGRISGNDLVFGRSSARSLAGEFDLANALSEAEGSASLRLDRALLAGVRADSARADFRLDGTGGGRFAVNTFGSAGQSIHAAAGFTRGDSATTVAMDSVLVRLGSRSWTLASPVRATLWQSGDIAIEPLRLTDAGRGELLLSGSIPAAEAVSFALDLRNVPAGDIGMLMDLPRPVAGNVDGAVRIAGTRATPRVQTELTLADAAYGSLSFDRIAGRVEYDGTTEPRLHTRFALDRRGRRALDLDLSLPVELTLFSARATGDSLRGTIEARAADFALVEAFSPGLQRATGSLSADLKLAGTFDAPGLTGRILVDRGEVDVRTLGVRLRDIAADIEFRGAGDSLVIRRASASSGRGGELSIGGSVSYANLRNPVFDVRLDARQFQAINRRSVASLAVSTTGDGLQLSGPMSGATLAGTLVVDRGSIYIPDIRGKELVQLTGDDFLAISDTTGLGYARIADAAPSALVENLRLSGVQVVLGDDVWLRSREANVKLGGALSVTRAEDPLLHAGAFGGRTRGDSVAYRLALAGTLEAERGTYTLQLGLVQREFQLERGTIDFYGTPDLNPALDISALYTVKQINRPDIGVRARLTGELYPQPTLTLESAESFQLSQSDLISYLVTGAPSFEPDQIRRTSASVLFPTVGTAASGLLRRTFPWVDQVRFEGGAADLSESAQLGRSAQEYFFSGTVGGEKQITDNLFFSLSTGLCALDPNSQSGELSFLDYVGGKLEYRFPRSLSVEAAREPPTSARLCGREGLRGVPLTPPQWAFSLARSWRF
jgi:translocation and assembly module TamB